MRLVVLVLSFVSAVAFSKEVVIVQKDKKFNVKSVEIEPGDILIFENQEKNITHNVLSLGPKNSFELKTQLPGTKSPVTFNDVGVTDVECAIHPGMMLHVTVKMKK